MNAISIIGSSAGRLARAGWLPVLFCLLFLIGTFPALAGYRIQVRVTGTPPVSAPPVGSITAWGLDNYGQVSNAPAGTGFTQVACGGYHCAALKP